MAMNKTAFLKVWPRCIVALLGAIELVASCILLFTELCNVGANFWVTNVFAGGWCGLVMIVHALSLFLASCCSPGPPSAFRAVVITFIALLATGCLIGFDAAFLFLPSTCILTPSCSSNAAQTNTFSYNFQQSFFSTFNGLSAFSSYSQSQTKFLFQVIQLSVGAFCFVLCWIYLIIYFLFKKKANRGQVHPAGESEYYQDQGQIRAARGGRPPPRMSQGSKNPRNDRRKH